MNFLGGQEGDGEASGTTLRFTTTFLLTIFVLALGLAVAEVVVADAKFGSTTATSKEVIRVRQEKERIFNDQTT